VDLVIYDLETTIPHPTVIDYEAVVLYPVRLAEKSTFSALVHSDKITSWSTDCNDITIGMVADALCFDAVADQIFEIMHGQTRIGHKRPAVRQRLSGQGLRQVVKCCGMSMLLANMGGSYGRRHLPHVGPPWTTGRAWQVRQPGKSDRSLVGLCATP
jgi:hypothetical protein